MFPCRGKSASGQVQELISGLAGVNYGMIWVDVETNPSTGCSYADSSHAFNCQFITDVISAIRSHGKSPGVYSSYYMWESIMGAAGNCAGHGSAPLWYAHYDNVESFSDFRAFGGWTKPNMKQYQGDVTLCGAGVDKSWY
jgi:hypothetical protein